MEEKSAKEWFLETTWGRVAMISWGEAHHPSILLVHGWMDTAATFIPLLRHLPDNYYYVGFDFPGHGKSDHVYSGPNISQTFMLEIVRRIVDHMRWESFVYLTHSMGFLTGLFYQHLYPGRIKRMINLDPLIPLTPYYHISYNLGRWFSLFYEYYHDHYHGIQARSKLLTLQQAVKSVMEIRHLSQEDAKVVLSRSLVPVENGLYRLSTQSTMRFIAHYPAHGDLLQYLLTESTTPMLNIIASDSKYYLKEEKEFGSRLLGILDESTQNSCVHVQGNHDVHITSPRLLAQHITEFLGRNDNFSSKL